MKISELLEAKVEMCPEACCGKPVTECKCGPDCKHCDCHAKNKMNEAAPSGAAMLAKVDMLLQNTGIKREGFKLVKDPKPQGMVRGSISQEAIDMVKATLAKAKAMGATDSPDPKPIMNPADVTDKDFNETTSAGSIASSMGGGNGFVGGGIGTVKRNNPKKKKRSNKS